MTNNADDKDDYDFVSRVMIVWTSQAIYMHVQVATYRKKAMQL